MIGCAALSSRIEPVQLQGRLFSTRHCNGWPGCSALASPPLREFAELTKSAWADEANMIGLGDGLPDRFASQALDVGETGATATRSLLQGLLW